MQKALEACNSCTQPVVVQEVRLGKDGVMTIVPAPDVQRDFAQFLPAADHGTLQASALALARAVDETGYAGPAIDAERLASFATFLAEVLFQKCAPECETQFCLSSDVPIRKLLSLLDANHQKQFHHFLLQRRASSITGLVLSTCKKGFLRRSRSPKQKKSWASSVFGGCSCLTQQVLSPPIPRKRVSSVGLWVVVTSAGEQ